MLLRFCPLCHLPVPSLESERTSMLCASYIIHTVQTHRFTQVQDTHQPAHTCLGLHSPPWYTDAAVLLPCCALSAIPMSSHHPADAWSPLTRWLTCQSSLPQGAPWPSPLVKCSHSTIYLPHFFFGIFCSFDIHLCLSLNNICASPIRL